MTKKNNQHWATLSESGFMFGMKLLFNVYLFVGGWPFKKLLAGVVFYFFLFRSQARRSSREYLQKLSQFAPELQIKPNFITILRHFMAFSGLLVDKLAAWSGKIELGEVARFGHEEVERVKESGKGALIIGSHFGNPEMCRALFRHIDSLKINVLVHTKHAPMFNQLLTEINPQSKSRLFQVTDITPATIIILQNKINQGELVYIAGDRVPVTTGNNRCDVDFLGSLAELPTGPYILAMLLECKVFLMFSFRQGKGYKIHFEPFAELITCTRQNRAVIFQQYAQLFADRMAFYCQQAPLQWANFYSFWKS